MTTKTNPANEPTGSLPTAIVSQRATRLQSRFWILTGLSLLLAVGLAWQSMPERGTLIVIHFPAGHGLHEGDAVRYRGIQVGSVRDIMLSDRDGVDVHVEMERSATRRLAKGAKFWIVRPQLALTGVSGLETAVGPKYIAFEPDSVSIEPPSREFEGLANPPAISAKGQGVEIVLRADKQFGVRPGSAVTYRGFDIGTIIDAKLTDDGRHVDLRASIAKAQQRLVTSESKFWANSGVDVDFSLRGGLSLDTESLETIARGGVSVLTTGIAGTPLAPGQVFTLHGQADDQWLVKANAIRLPTVPLKGAITLVIEAEKSGLLGKRTDVKICSAIPVVDSAGAKQLVVPTSTIKVLSHTSSTEKTTAHIDGVSKPEELALIQSLLASAAATQSGGGGPIARIVAPPTLDLNWQRPSSDRLVPTDVLIARHPIGGPADAYVHLSIDTSMLAASDDGSLIVTGLTADPGLWNGSPALSKLTGDIVGVLIFDQNATSIIPL